MHHDRRRLQALVAGIVMRGAMADAGVMPWEIDQAGDYGWVLSRTVAILSMQGGFALLEAGSVRPANRANIMMKNICDKTVGLVERKAALHPEDGHAPR